MAQITELKEESEQDEKEIETASKASSVFEKDRTVPPVQEALNTTGDQDEPVVADGQTEDVASPKSPKRSNSREVPATKSPRETPELKRGPSRTGSITPNSKAARQSPVAKSSPTPIATPVASTPSLLHPALHGELTPNDLNWPQLTYFDLLILGMGQLNNPLGSLLNGQSAGGLPGLNIQQQLLLAQQQLAAQQSQQAHQAQIQQLQQALALSMANQSAALNPVFGGGALAGGTGLGGALGAQANPAAAQQAQNILAAVQAQAALQQRTSLSAQLSGANPFSGGLGGITGETPGGAPGALHGAKASAQQAISAAEKMYRDALQARMGGLGQNQAGVPSLNPVQTSSEILKQLTLLRSAHKQ